MTTAVDAMGRAVTALASLKTGAALPPEMQALNALLEAQALVKKRQVSRQQSAQGGPGNNNRNYDVSTLFDKELQRLQETNYESRQSNQQAQARRSDGRQDQRAGAPAGRAASARAGSCRTCRRHERKRELEKLTREQAELRQQAEEMAKSSSLAEGRRAGHAGRDERSAAAGRHVERRRAAVRRSTS